MLPPVHIISTSNFTNLIYGRGVEVIWDVFPLGIIGHTIFCLVKPKFLVSTNILVQYIGRFYNESVDIYCASLYEASNCLLLILILYQKYSW